MRLHYLDLLRLLLAFCVVQYHVFNQIHKGTQKLLEGSHLAVDCFFILSGFVLTMNIAAKNLNFSQFLVQRIARIFPLFWLSLLLIIGVNNINFCGNLYDFFTQIFLVHALGFTSHLGWNYPSWALSVEFWLNISLLFFLVKNIEKNPQKEGIIMATIFSLFALSIFFIRFKGGNFDLHQEPALSFTSIGVVRCIIGFLIGVLVYYASKSRLIVANFSKSVPYIFLCEVIFLCLLAVCLLKGGKSLSFLCVFLVFPLIVLISAVRANLSVLNKAFSLPILKELGHFSFGVYLLHVPILYCLANVGWFVNKNPSLQIIILCVMVFFVSIPVYYLYEKKAKKFLIEKLS